MKKYQGRRLFAATMLGILFSTTLSQVVFAESRSPKRGGQLSTERVDPLAKYQEGQPLKVSECRKLGCSVDLDDRCKGKTPDPSGLGTALSCTCGSGAPVCIDERD
jgi:hypothetical protein